MLKIWLLCIAWNADAEPVCLTTLQTHRQCRVHGTTNEQQTEHWYPIHWKCEKRK